MEIDFNKHYDELLDVKKAKEYKREFKNKIKDNEVGLEIEVAVNYKRDSYSFIKKMLTKVKEAVGENGFFVKDGTILGEYAFEIVLDPMNSKDVFNIYSKIVEIVDFSSGLLEISKEKNCGIHLNFNKPSKENEVLAHKEMTAYILKNMHLFEENIYKQVKIIDELDEYIIYQNEIADKYVFINYLKEKIVEMRNIKASISPLELKKLLDELINILYSLETESLDTIIVKEIKKIINNNTKEILELFKNKESFTIDCSEGVPKLIVKN